MYTPRYHYLGIYHDSELSVHCNSIELIHYLRTFPELRQTDYYTFGNSEVMPLYFKISLLYARKLNNWSEKDINAQKTNLIDIVCSKDNAAAFEQFRGILIKIASHLNWKLIDEQDEDGNENIILWAPFYT